MHDNDVPCNSPWQDEWTVAADLLRGQVIRLLLLHDKPSPPELLTMLEAAKQAYWFEVFARSLDQQIDKQRNTWGNCEH